MPIILSHKSALERLRAVPPQFDKATIVNRETSLREIKISKEELSSLDIERLGIMSEPIHCLVHRDVPRTRSHRFTQHRTSLDHIPPGLLRQIEPGMFTSSSELVFAQVAHEKPLLNLIVLGFELCGIYSHFAPFASGFYEREPLTTTGSISDALDALSRCRGLAVAHEALEYVLDGSASPMETVFSCMLVLPNSMGGEGLTMPELNHEVPLDEVGKRIAGTRTCRVDIAWPDQKKGLEYLGGPYHTDEKKDRLRREALSHEGWTIYSADIDRMANHGKYVDLLGLIKGDIPRRAGEGCPDDETSKDLFRKLMTATRAGIGLNKAVFSVTVPRGAVKIHV